ncbi:hypothetical protein EQG41_14310 [Billgrantia azerbaijanica]|nr:hypothetical protein EQG41_14310 [Halomonas azerbaijanica]
MRDMRCIALGGIALLGGLALSGLGTPTVRAEAPESREWRVGEPAGGWHERAPWRKRWPERRQPSADVEVIVDGEWLERWRGLEALEDRGGPDVCRQRGRITWSTRRLACPDRLPIEGLRRYSTRPDD